MASAFLFRAGSFSIGQICRVEICATKMSARCKMSSLAEGSPVAACSGEARPVYRGATIIRGPPGPAAGESDSPGIDTIVALALLSYESVGIRRPPDSRNGPRMARFYRAARAIDARHARARPVASNLLNRPASRNGGSPRCGHQIGGARRAALTQVGR